MNEDIFNIGLFLVFLGFIWMYLDYRKPSAFKNAAEEKRGFSLRKNLRTIAMVSVGFVIMAIALLIESFPIL